MNKQAVPLAVRRHRLVAAVRTAMHEQHVLVGVSGGADSVALLLLCCAAALQDSADFQVVAAHIHHGLRDAADDEQKMVEGLCANIGIRCITKRVTVERINGSIGAGARKVRYEALGEIATQLNINTIAVAHHAEDQLESMLMALCRGGGIRKLSGMASTRALTDCISLIRPLLHVNKSELEEICQEAGVTWCNDPTNSDAATPRGRLRKDVLPILRELWPAADRHAANASILLNTSADVLETQIPEGTQWKRETLAALPIPIIAAAVHRAIGDRAKFETVQLIAKAVVDNNTDPRTFPCESGCIARVTAHDVSIDYS